MARNGIYLSGAPEDAKTAERLARALEGRQCEVVVDGRGLRQGRMPSAATEAERAACSTLVVALSAQTIANRRVQQDLMWFRATPGAHIIMVQVEPLRAPPAMDDAVMLDATTLTLDETVDAILSAIPAPGLSRRALLLGAGAVALAAAGGGFWLWRDRHGAGVGDVSGPTGTPLPDYLPATLAALGYQGQVIQGVTALVPPVKDVAAGPFAMGSATSHDPAANADELPQTTLTLAEFHVALCPVTVAEYALAVRANAVPAPVDVGTLTWKFQLTRPDHPVVNLTWAQATAYAAWLAKVTGQPWRLPTEAEWEKAARGASGTIYPWGDAWDKSRANTAENGPQDTTAVGTYPTGASPCGARDMAGNVYEWCSSLYKPYPYKPTDGRENAKDVFDNRVLRGGSWQDGAPATRCAYRYFYPGVNVQSGDVGMRLVLGAPTL